MSLAEIVIYVYLHIHLCFSSTAQKNLHATNFPYNSSKLEITAVLFSIKLYHNQLSWILLRKPEKLLQIMSF